MVYAEQWHELLHVFQPRLLAPLMESGKRCWQRKVEERTILIDYFAYTCATIRPGIEWSRKSDLSSSEMVFE